MDYIRQFDIKLEREVYYSGETVNGYVIMDTVQNVKVRAIRAVLRGKCTAEWKIMKSGQRHGVQDYQYFIDDKITLWGNEKKDDLSIPILEAGYHQFPFKFPLPDTTLPCSFESKAGKIRYYVKVTIDIPYASPPQGIKHFTIIGPTIDCSDAKFMTPILAEDMKVICCFCFKHGPVSLNCTLNRSAYCSGERIELRSDIDNQGNEGAFLRVRLVQHVEYFIDVRAIGITKYLTHNIIDYKSDEVPVNEKRSFTDNAGLTIPVTPPTLIGIAKNIQIYYVLKVCLDFARKGEDLHLNFPVTIATVPLSSILDEPQRLVLAPASDNVEGGMYTSPEFQLGQVYDGTFNVAEDVVLYRPVYVKVLSQPYSLPATTQLSITDNKQQKQSSAVALRNKAANGSPSNHSNYNNSKPLSAASSGADIGQKNSLLLNPSQSIVQQHLEGRQATKSSKKQPHIEQQNSREQLLTPQQAARNSGGSSASKKASSSQHGTTIAAAPAQIDDDDNSAANVDEDRDIRLALHDTSGQQPQSLLLLQRESSGYLEPTSAAALAASHSASAVDGNNTLADTANIIISSSAGRRHHQNHSKIKSHQQRDSLGGGGGSSGRAENARPVADEQPPVVPTGDNHRGGASTTNTSRPEPSSSLSSAQRSSGTSRQKSQDKTYQRVDSAVVGEGGGDSNAAGASVKYVSRL